MIPSEMKTDGTVKKSKRMIVIVIVIVVALILAVVAVYLLLSSSRPLRILSVSITPLSPTPNDAIKVTTQVEGGSFFDSLHVEISYNAYFADSISGGGGGGGFMSGGFVERTWEIGPYPNGTEVWLLVIASTNTQGPVFSENHIIQVGQVLRNGSSGLKIEHVRRSVENPTSLDDVVVSARITSSVNITRVDVISVQCSRHSSGSGNSNVVDMGNGTYNATIMPIGPGMTVGTEKGTIWFYRVVAIDESGNTAASEIFSFTVA